MIAWFRSLAPIVRRALVGVVAFCLMAVIIVGVSYCSEKRRAAEFEARASMADARSAAATDSHKIRDANEDAHAATRAEVKDATDDLRQADPAHRDRVFRDRVCRLDPTACPR
jgi:type II secretory pathway component PulM